MAAHALELEGWVRQRAQELDVPGLAVGVLHEGQETYVVHGVTSVENPLPVDEHTLFQFGSTGKTFTATALMRLVEQGRVDLDAPVRTYVPELRLKDQDTARRVTVLHLLNHTAGWEGDLFEPTGEGDDALARYVERMAKLEQVTPLGEAASYNNASLSLAGRVLEKVTGQSFEQAMKELVFEPLGLERCFYFPTDIMTRRFATGHTRHPDGTIVVARPWALPRGVNPAGGISSDIHDQLVWARFHLGDGRARNGQRVLSEELLRRMQQPTVATPAGALGDAIGISWMLRDVDGVRVVGHGGDTNGQHSLFKTVPERGFAVACLTNCGPNGNRFNDDLWRWALEAYLGVIDREPEPVALSPEQLAPYAGTYETIAATCEVRVDGGGLVLETRIKPEVLAQISEQGEEEPPEQPPYPVGLLASDGDQYIITGGLAKGMRGYFARDDAGRVVAVHVGGRLATRVATADGGR